MFADGLIEKAEQAAKEHLEERIRTEVLEAAESKVIADFKARTEETIASVIKRLAQRDL